MDITVQLNNGQRVDPATITCPAYLGQFYAMTIRSEALASARTAFPALVAAVGESATLFGDVGRMVFCHLRKLAL